MKLEDQVVSLELAKKIKALGVKQEGLFYWKQSERMTDEPYTVEYFYDGKPFKAANIYSAFTVAELGEILPDNTDTKKVSDDYFVVTGATSGDVHADGNTEADARARMLIYLIENNLITV